MQVRSNLHIKKQQRLKLQKQSNFLLIPKSKKRLNVTNIKSHKSRSQSKSKSHSDKQNQKYKKVVSKSKSKQKVSPLKYRPNQGLNTSPILSAQKNCKFKRSPIRFEDKSAKTNRTLRQHQLFWQTISTKLNSQRTPNKKVRSKSKGKKELITKKSKKSTKPKNKNVNSYNKNKNKQKKFVNQLQNTTQIQNLFKDRKQQQSIRQKQKEFGRRQQAFKKAKKAIPEISTRVPQRKQSYFDKQIIQKLNSQNYQYFRKKNAKKYQQTQLQRQNGQNQRQKKFTVSTQQNIHNTVSYRQFGTSTDQTYLNLGYSIPNTHSPIAPQHQNPSLSPSSQPPVSYRDLQSFRKQQQLKWRIIYLQLNQLKLVRTPQKIQYILQESNRNVNQFQEKCRTLVQSNSHIVSNYVIESPRKIMDVMRNSRSRRSSEVVELENRELVKTLSDHKLLHELEILDNFQEISHIKNFKQQNDKPSSSSFCLQFQKQLQSLAKQSNNHIPQQVEHIPQLQYQKSTKIVQQIQSQLLLQFSQQLLESQTLLHSYLLFIRRPESDSQIEQNYQKIQSSNSYSLKLVLKLFEFVRAQQYESVIVSRANVAYGRAPLVVLRILRNSIEEIEEEVEDDTMVEQCVDADLLNLFEAEAYTESIVENQYFYHHCVYGCINQILDSLRPHGTTGLPPLESTAPPIHKNITELFNKIYSQLGKILQVRMGRSQFDQGQNPLQIAENSYRLLDKFLIADMEELWKKMRDDVFEEKYFLAQSIVLDVFNEEILMIYNQFL